MSRITMELLRKRSEHNEGEIHNLEEIALHQQNIGKIELLNHACRNLRILLLQNNIISKIENLNKLKKLEYLNLAINNIEIIENLQGLESLQKLDLTANFIGDLRSVKSLRYNDNLRELILMGNPCADYEEYRPYVAAVLPQLKEFDMMEITRSERIKALQFIAASTDNVIQRFQQHNKLRQTQIEEHAQIKEVNEKEEEDEDENTKFWNKKCKNTPETRVSIAERRIKLEQEREGFSETKVEKQEVTFFDKDGKPYNMNRAKVPFTLMEHEKNITLEVGIYKHLDTSHVDVDIQTFYVRVTIKGKVLQLTLPCEICTEKSFAKRNIVTGSLTITMPRLQPSTIIRGKNLTSRKNGKDERCQNKNVPCMGTRITKRESLEIGPPLPNMDFSQIVKNTKLKKRLMLETAEDAEFVDNPDVPPLE